MFIPRKIKETMHYLWDPWKKASGLTSISPMRSDGRREIQSVYLTESMLHSEPIVEVLTTGNKNNKELKTKTHKKTHAA